MEKMKIYRLYSVLLRTAYVTCCVLICAAISFGASSLKHAVPLLASSTSWPFFLMLPPLVCGALMVILGLPLAILKGCREPYVLSQPPTFRQWLISGIFGGLGLALLAFAVFVGVMVVRSVMLSGSFEEKGLTYEETVRNSRINRFAVARMIPPQATEINVSGDSAAILPFGGLHFNCLVAEPDFRAFASEQGYVLSTNVFRNANAAINDKAPYLKEMDFGQIEGVLNSGVDASCMTNYLGYWCGYSNGGGLVLLYDLNCGVLYGCYLTN